MADSIEDSDVRRADENIDPTALNAADIEEEMPEDFSREAKQAFAERVSEQREAVAEQFDFSKRQFESGSGTRQLQGPNGQFGPSVEKVEGTELQRDGTLNAVLEDGSRFTVERLDLNRGAEGGRADNW